MCKANYNQRAFIYEIESSEVLNEYRKKHTSFDSFKKALKHIKQQLHADEYAKTRIAVYHDSGKVFYECLDIAGDADIERIANWIKRVALKEVPAL